METFVSFNTAGVQYKVSHSDLQRTTTLVMIVKRYSKD